MKKILACLFLVLLFSAPCLAQVGGGAALLQSGGEGYDVCSETDLHEHWPLTSDGSGECNNIDLTDVNVDAGDWGSDGVDLDGSTEYLYTDTDFTWGDDLTVIAFIKLDADNTLRYVVAQYDTGNNERVFGHVISVDDEIRPTIGAGSPCGTSYDENDSTGTMAEDGTQYMIVLQHDDTDDDTWGHIYATSDCQIITNGTMEDLTLPSDASDCIAGSQTERLTVGARLDSGSPTGYFDGHVKSVMIFSGTDILSSTKLEQICEAYRN